MSGETSAEWRLLLIDGNQYIWRAYHALPPRFRPDGLQVNALNGVVEHLLKRIVLRGRASHVAILFDAEGKGFRHEIYPRYKENRAEPPADLTAQLPLVREAAAAFNITGVELDGYEADDLIATYARLGAEAGMPVSIVSGDKDLMQLVDDASGVSIYHPQQKRVLREAQVVEKFGVPPYLVPDVQALAGDAVDGVPGVTGIGVKTGAALIETYGGLEQLLRAADQLPQKKRRERLIAEADAARLSRRLVTLDAFAPVTVPLGDFAVRGFDTATVRGFLETNGFEVPGPWV